MPKAGSSLTYDLLRQMNSPSGFSYTAYDSLYAWYKFDETLTSSGELTDYSNNSRGLGPKSDLPVYTPGAPVSDSPFLKSFSLFLAIFTYLPSISAPINFLPCANAAMPAEPTPI